MAQKFQVTQQIALGGKRSGTLTFVPSGFEFESKKGKLSIQAKDISGIVWARSSDGFQLRLLLKPNGAHSFAGFKEQDLAAVEEHARILGKTVQTRSRNVAGYNWGDFQVQGNHLVFEVDKAAAFEIPLAQLTQCVVQGKNEVALEMDPPEDADQSCSLVEMRVYVPPIVDAKTQEEVSGAEEFSKFIIDSADLGKQNVEPVAVFKHVNFQVPRGKYQIEMFPTELKLHGATFHYRISYKNIHILVLLDHPDLHAYFFVIGLNPPLRQGQTSYGFLLVQFSEDEETTLTVNMDEKKIEEEYKNLIKAHMQGKTYDICSRLFKALTQRKLIVPQTFQSAQSQRDGAGGRPYHYVRCSYKANDGWLYVLERSFFFIKKPVLWIRHDEIESVEFARLQGAGTATFDLVFNMTDGVTFVFNGINKTEQKVLFDFMKSKKLNILNEKEASAPVVEGARGRIRAEVDYSDDPYMLKIKADAAREELEGGGSSDDSEDEDYAASSESDESSSSSDEEGGAELVSESDLEEESKSAKSGAKRKRDEDDEDGKKKKKKRKKEKEDKDKKKKKKKEKKEKKDKKEKKEKKKKEKAPKGLKVPPNAFQLFCNEVRSAVAKENPDLKSSEITKLLQDRWEKLSPEDRAPYEELAKKERARYNEQLASLPQAMEEGGDA